MATVHPWISNLFLHLTVPGPSAQKTPSLSLPFLFARPVSLYGGGRQSNIVWHTEPIYPPPPETPHSLTALKQEGVRTRRVEPCIHRRQHTMAPSRILFYIYQTDTSKHKLRYSNNKTKWACLRLLRSREGRTYLELQQVKCISPYQIWTEINLQCGDMTDHWLQVCHHISDTASKAPAPPHTVTWDDAVKPSVQPLHYIPTQCHIHSELLVDRWPQPCEWLHRRNCENMALKMNDFVINNKTFCHWQCSLMV